jgi:hypothetical protein
MEKDGVIQKQANTPLEDKVHTKKQCSKCKLYSTSMKCKDCHKGGN